MFVCVSFFSFQHRPTENTFRVKGVVYLSCVQVIPFPKALHTINCLQYECSIRGYTVLFLYYKGHRNVIGSSGNS